MQKNASSGNPYPKKDVQLVEYTGWCSYFFLWGLTLTLMFEMLEGFDAMKNVTCEDFEREFEQLSSEALDDVRRDALVAHQQSCQYCMSFSESVHPVRDALLNMAELEVPPYFEANLKREINRLESGLSKPKWESGLLPRFVALGTGFALALIVSFIVLQPGQQPGTNPAVGNPGVVAESETLEQPKKAERGLTVPEESDLLLTNSEADLDTATHRLPEPAGTDSIPIPIEDDFWQLNKVSTTPDDN